MRFIGATLWTDFLFEGSEMCEDEQANPDDAPRSLGDPEVLERRRALLNCRHMERLNRYVAELRAEQKGVELPDFDPLDGGISA